MTNLKFHWRHYLWPSTRLGWVNLACQMKPFLYSAILRKIRGSHSVSNFTEIIFLKFCDINFENFGAFSLAENKSSLKVIFDHGNEFLRLNWSEKHFFYFRFFFKNGIFWSLKIMKIGIFSQNQFFFGNFEIRTGWFFYMLLIHNLLTRRKKKFRRFSMRKKSFRHLNSDIYMILFIFSKNNIFNDKLSVLFN